jgi:uncharacterized membrane protein (DUF485 family)
MVMAISCYYGVIILSVVILGGKIMNDRTYRLIFGALLLLALYFDFSLFIYFAIVILFVEGATNRRITYLADRIRGTSSASDEANDNLAPLNRDYRFNFEAERAWRLVSAFMLLVTYVLFYDTLWFFPWFMAFALFGAGASGVCPLLTGIKWAGFK